MAFQFLFSWTREELLFRAMVITPIIFYRLKNSFSKKKISLIAAGIGTIIFILAHINFTINPFRITYFNLLQQITCFIFGVF